MKKFIFISSLILSIVYGKANSPVLVKHLACEYIENPLGIDVAKPRFSWELASSARNQIQSAFELIVSDNLQSVRDGKGDMWSSGK